jgi:hypothetical protein
MGVLVSYRSPGDTWREAAYGGVGLALMTLVGIRTIEGIEVSPIVTSVGFFCAVMLAGLGGWGGEVLQGTHTGSDDKGLRWPWVGVGTLLGVMLSIYAVFLPDALWSVGPLGVLVFLSASFFAAAFFVGFFSPGVTIIEPAFAGMLIVGIDTLLVLLGFGIPFPVPVIAMGMTAAFLIALVGGYLGEVAHNVRSGAAWGDQVGVFKQTSKPE